MVTIATTHSGGEGVGVGARSAGLTHLWGIEFDERICEVARANGFHSLCADVNSVGLRSLEPPDVLHSSPVCKNASVAKAKRGEREGDIESGKSVVSFIRFLRPKIFTLENVWGYRKFEAFKLILDTLTELGYAWDVTHVNAADFGVPQTRKRLILRATRYGKRVLPPYPAKEAWVGWYAAIEDLIPTLPESKFAPWQLARLPEDIRESFASDMANPSREYTVREQAEPFPTVVATMMRRPVGEPRAFIANTREMHDYRQVAPLTTPSGESPVMTLSATGDASRLKAFIATNQASDDKRGGTYGVTTRRDDEPFATVRPTDTPKAFIADGKLNDRSTSLTTREGEHPMFTLSTSHNMRDVKAFVMPGGNSSNENPARTADEPVATIQGMQRNNGTIRAWLSSGRVVAMTPRCLARFQSFPDSYILPEKKSLAATVIGNAVPPLLYQKIVRQLADTL